ncbi:MAG TPA: helix-turn-helix domain-containing protein, partial [Chitinispirillaceae bacterium]|nr:helix-turn-helix domain-containing protein [Chitinispirillaceae bacterium]
MNEYTDRQLQIIDAAIELIAQGGIQQLTMKNLSKRIGISEPAIYRHFENKSSILEAIQDTFSIGKQTLVNDIIYTHLSGIDKIQKFIEMHFAAFHQKPTLASVIFSEEIFQNEQHLADMITKIMD